MNKVIEKIRVLHDMLETRLAEVDDEKKKLVGKTAKLKEKENVSDARAGDLNTREIAVKGIEDVVKLSSDAEALSKETEKALAELDIQRKAFSETQSRVSVEHSQKATELSNRKTILDNREKEIEGKNAKIEDLVTAEVKKILKK